MPYFDIERGFFCGVCLDEKIDMVVFDIKRDIAIEQGGGFFCEACTEGKIANKQSPDPRYCKTCYDFLLKEAEFILPSWSKKPSWIPVIRATQRPQNAYTAV